MSGSFKVISFGFKHRNEPTEANKVFDCRSMINPYGDKRLRSLTGQNERVQQYMMTDARFVEAVERAVVALNVHRVIAFGCLGGRHRSVAAAELVARRYTDAGYAVEIEHLDL